MSIIIQNSILTRVFLYVNLEYTYKIEHYYTKEYTHISIIIHKSGLYAQEYYHISWLKRIKHFDEKRLRAESFLEISTL